MGVELSIKWGGRSQKPETEVKCQKKNFIGKICLSEFYRRERRPGPSVTAGVPLSQNEQKTKQNNVTVVLLGLPAVRDGPVP